MGGNSTCEACPAGQYDDDGSVVTACALCPAGQYTNVSGSVSCTSCGAGLLALNGGATVCSQAISALCTDSSYCSGVVACGQSIVGSTSGALNLYGNSAGDSIWFFAVEAASSVRFDSCGSGFDTWLRVASTDLTVQHRSCDDCGPCGTRTVLDVDLATAGVYALVIDGYGSSEGAYNVDMMCLDPCRGLTPPEA
eukprot:COSAG02_NODE_28735_length_583_cov_1.487603_1_plen_194_part_11